MFFILLLINFGLSYVCGENTEFDRCVCGSEIGSYKCSTEGCKTCEEIEKNCKYEMMCMCPVNYFYREKECFPMCFGCDPAGVCSAPGEFSCQEGYHDENKDCTKCSPLCSRGCGVNEVCVAPEQCECAGGYLRIKGVCTNKCPVTTITANCTYPAGYRCTNASCTPVCTRACGGNESCIAPDTCGCAQGFVRVNGSCIDQLPRIVEIRLVEPNITCPAGYVLTNGTCALVCSPACNNHSICVSGNKCVCDSEWEGTNCELPRCSPLCTAQQYCGMDHACHCLSWWKTTNASSPCTAPVCDANCTDANNRVCARPEFCTCKFGFIETNGRCVLNPKCGEYYNSERGVCSGHGACTATNRCQCDEGYHATGPICEIDRCNGLPYNSAGVCDGHGVCVNQTCVCGKSYYLLHGHCVEKLCNNVNWSSPRVCSGHGSCETSTGTCFCMAGWYGVNCDLDACVGPARQMKLCKKKK